MADAAAHAVATAAPIVVAAADSSSEWEYEYSTTETETHLITLDLSVPEFVRQRDDIVVHNTRGGFRSWQNPLNIDDARPFKGLGGGDGDSEDGGGEGGGELVEDSDRDGDDAPENKGGNASTKLPPPTQPDEPDATEIQILDLHASEPIVAYRGMLFKGAWSETIGTEMLFAETASTDDGAASASLDAKSIHVTDNVDLVGASSARITCAPTEMVPRTTVGKADMATTKKADGPKKKGLGFVIPVGGNASLQRQQQASFLEQLMALKHRHGEPDVVTVQAVETKQNVVRGDVAEAKRRARRETQLQVHQERRAKRLRGALITLGEGEGGEGDANKHGDDTTMLDSPQAQTPSQAQPTRRRRTASRRGRSRLSDLSQIARVAGDDDLLAFSAVSARNRGKGDGTNEDGNDDERDDEPSSSEEDYDDGE